MQQPAQCTQLVRDSTVTVQICQLCERTPLGGEMESIIDRIDSIDSIDSSTQQAAAGEAKLSNNSNSWQHRSRKRPHLQTPVWCSSSFISSTTSTTLDASGQHHTITHTRHAHTGLTGHNTQHSGLRHSGLRVETQRTETQRAETQRAETRRAETQRPP